MSDTGFQSFQEFWPFYLGEHSNGLNRWLHFTGTSLVIALFVLALVMGGDWLWLLAILPICGYGFAWVGHFIIEHNRPATFKHPLWSLIGDFKMWWLMLTGRLGGEIERLTTAAQSR